MTHFGSKFTDRELWSLDQYERQILEESERAPEGGPELDPVTADEDLARKLDDLVCLLEYRSPRLLGAGTLAVLESLAYQGNVHAQYFCGLYHGKICWVPQRNLPLAITFMEMAARQNHRDAAALTGMFYSLSGDTQNPERALFWLQKSPLPHSRYLCGQLYDGNHGFARDDSQALQWYLQAANAGHIDAMLVCGQFLEEGRGTQQDYAAARSWYEKAMATGNTEGYVNCAGLYESGKGVPRDWAKAFALYREAAESRHPKGLWKCAAFLAEGKGVPQNIYRARRYWEALPYGYPGEQQMPKAEQDAFLQTLGLIHGYPNDEKTVALYARDAENGSVISQLILGDLYCEDNQDYDPERALYWYEKAAVQGCPDAQLLCAQLYRDLNDLPKSRYWYQQAEAIPDHLGL